MPSYLVTLKGKPRIPARLSSSASYNEERDATTLTLDAESKNKAFQIGSKIGDVLGVSKEVENAQVSN